MLDSRSLFPDDPLHSKQVYKYNSLPQGWVLINVEPTSVPTPPGWQWAHNDKDMFTSLFRVALIRTRNCL